MLAENLNHIRKLDQHVIRVSQLRHNLSEWGVPCGGRKPLISKLFDGERVLWVCSQPGVKIYPPAWEAAGADLKKLSVAYSTNPIKDLQSVFLNKIFSTIVLDGGSLKKQDYIFLQQRAREFGKSILILKNHFLSHKFGNIWTRYRINCFKDPLKENVRLKMMRGGYPSLVKLEGSQCI